jgi:hypothetical protein
MIYDLKHPGISDSSFDRPNAGDMFKIGADQKRSNFVFFSSDVIVYFEIPLSTILFVLGASCGFLLKTPLNNWRAMSRRSVLQ